MEQDGIIGPANHAGKRDILTTPPNSHRDDEDED